MKQIRRQTYGKQKIVYGICTETTRSHLETGGRILGFGRWGEHQMDARWLDNVRRVGARAIHGDRHLTARAFEIVVVIVFRLPFLGYREDLEGLRWGGR